MRPDRRLGALLAAHLAVACRPGPAQSPWGEASAGPAAGRDDVRTVSPGYARTRSQVWVREVTRPTRAALDYAAYHANFMIADLEPESPLPADVRPDVSNPFSGKLETASLTADIASTSLSAQERRQPLAFAPLSEWLQSRKVEGAAELAEVGSAVRSERWGVALPPGISSQQLSELFVHEPNSGPPELWAKVEFQPWFSPFRGSADQDGDGYPEIYGRVPPALTSAAVVASIQREYASDVLEPAEVNAWANHLSSYWYPSFNTDLLPAGEHWPDEHTEQSIQSELGGSTFAAPTIVLRGKPLGPATYNVFLVRGDAPEASAGDEAGPLLALSPSQPSPRAEPVVAALKAELERSGASNYAAWQARLRPFHQALRKRMKAIPPGAKAVAGTDGYLFFEGSLKYVVGGDLEKQPEGKNPLPIIVEFKRQLEQRGVDFLFVPVPTKVEIFPEKLEPEFSELDGAIVNPYLRKLVSSLSREGVEVLDLLPAFLGAKGAAGESLYQHQDTHWGDRGLRLAAERLGARIREYPWYPQLARHTRDFTEREVSFTRFGDLHSRLPEPEQKSYTPETLAAHQVLGPDQQPYAGDPRSPIVLLGDSFTAVYELMDAEHAGVSAHIARGIGYPLDLVMSYGGGPNVRTKLLRRGWDSLETKRLVIWMMTARDLYDYWEEWEPLSE